MSDDDSLKDYFCKAPTSDHAYNYNDSDDDWTVVNVCDGCARSRL